MKASRHERINQAFVLKAEDVECLTSFLSENISNPEFEIQMLDNITRTTNNIDEALGFENSLKRRIKFFKISAHANDPYRYCNISFSEDMFSPIVFDFDVPEPIAIKLNEIIEDRLEAVKPWYHLISKIDFFKVFIFFIIGLMLIVLLSKALGWLPASSQNAAAIDSATDLMLLALIGLPFLGGFIINKLRSKIFPIAFFAIGQGKDRHKKWDILRITVIGGFLISLIAGIIANAI